MHLAQIQDLTPKEIRPVIHLRGLDGGAHAATDTYDLTIGPDAEDPCTYALTLRRPGRKPVLLDKGPQEALSRVVSQLVAAISQAADGDLIDLDTFPQGAQP